MSTQDLLTINNLGVEVENSLILNDVNLSLNYGEIHAIMGPNGSGKSTLSKVIAGHPSYKVTKGDILYKNESLLNKETNERALEGIFLAFQYPVEIPGVSNADFLRLSYNAQRKQKGLKEVDPIEFFQLISSKLDLVGMDPTFLNRNVNEGFSGGEKKRNEILQMALLNPTLGILDETDSGLDIDALKTIANGINTLSTSENCMLIITHYQRLLNYVKPHFVHVMQDGKITATGDASLAEEVETHGYKWLEKAQ